MTNPEGFWTFQNGLVFESQHLSRGVFLLAVLDFIIGLAIFLAVKQMNGLKTPELQGLRPREPVATMSRPYLITRPNVRTVRPTSKVYCDQSERDHSFQYQQAKGDHHER